MSPAVCTVQGPVGPVGRDHSQCLCIYVHTNLNCKPITSILEALYFKGSAIENSLMAKLEIASDIIGPMYLIKTDSAGIL